MAKPSSPPHVSARLRDATVPWLLPAAILVGWQAAVSAGFVSNRFMPAPLDVADLCSLERC